MRIAALRGREAFQIEEAPVPELRPDEVLVRVVVSGVCASELEPWVEGPPAGKQNAARTATYSANPRSVTHTPTRSPTARPVTSVPSSVTTPLTS